LAPDSRDAKHILEHIFAQIVEFKKMNQDIDLDVPDAVVTQDGEGTMLQEAGESTV
jgi:hypothetical protein